MINPLPRKWPPPLPSLFRPWRRRCRPATRLPPPLIVSFFLPSGRRTLQAGSTMLIAEAEFIVSGFPADSYLCYSHVLRALPPDVIAAVRDLVRIVTPETLELIPASSSLCSPATLPLLSPTAFALLTILLSETATSSHSSLICRLYYQLMPTFSSTPTSSVACRSPCRVRWSARVSFPLESSLKPPPCCPIRRWQPPFRYTRLCRCRRRRLRS